MSAQARPSLAFALAAAASALLRLDDREADFHAGFAAAVTLLDAADRDYRRAIEETLPPAAAAALLDAMTAFRERVHQVRESARVQIAALYARNGLAYGEFDPLDPYLPATTALSHVDGTRVATLADAARSEVERLRATVNGAAAERLLPAQLAALIEAKRRRREAFEAALERALELSLASHPTPALATTDRTLYALTQLADGWY